MRARGHDWRLKREEGVVTNGLAFCLSLKGVVDEVDGTT